MIFLSLFFRGENGFIESSIFSMHAARTKLGTDSAKKISRKTLHGEKQLINSLETYSSKV